MINELDLNQATVHTSSFDQQIVIGQITVEGQRSFLFFKNDDETFYFLAQFNAETDQYEPYTDAISLEEARVELNGYDMMTLTPALMTA